jgi:hypothetical protein
MCGRHGIGLLCLAVAGCHLVFPHQGAAPAGDGPDFRPDGPLPDRSDLCTSADCGPGTEGGVTPAEGGVTPAEGGVIPPGDGGSVVDAPAVPDSGGGCSGCWASNVCVPGDTDQACGRGGVVCSFCNVGAVCSSTGVCVPASCLGCTLGQCCTPLGACQPSDKSHCGRPGELCEVCLGGQACVSGRCIASPCACGGCCESWGCFKNSGANDLHCGLPGEPCEACIPRPSAWRGPAFPPDVDHPTGRALANRKLGNRGRPVRTLCQHATTPTIPLRGSGPGQGPLRR